MNARPICLHFVAFDGCRCLVGRQAPHDCGGGCPAYLDEIVAEADADEDERHRRAVWGRSVIQEPGS